MTKDDVIRMARDAGFPFNKYGLLEADDEGEIDADEMLERFAALVEKHVMEASMPGIKLAMKAERENGAREERERCEELWESLRISDRQIQETIEASITAERERCAKLVEDMDMRHSWKYADMLRRGVSE